MLSGPGPLPPVVGLRASSWSQWATIVRADKHHRTVDRCRRLAISSPGHPSAASHFALTLVADGRGRQHGEIRDGAQTPRRLAPTPIPVLVPSSHA
jgi:hypothetical protein